MPIRQAGCEVWRQVARDLIERCAPSARSGHDLVSANSARRRWRPRRPGGPSRTRAGGPTAIRSKPVRITLDLSPELYRQLTGWADSAAVTLDVPRVSLADAVRAMIRVTADNPDEVLDRLAPRRGAAVAAA